MSRIITVASAQLGAIEREESRASVMNRMPNMMRQAQQLQAQLQKIQEELEIQTQLMMQEL